MSTLTLTGDLRLPDAPALVADLATLLGAGPAVVDATGLTRTDTAVLQVLLAAQRQARRQGRTLDILMPAGGQPLDLARRLHVADLIAGQSPAQADLAEQDR